MVPDTIFPLMPNHIHFVLKSFEERGIALFMQKVFTAYTMYFNKRYHRTGALFAGTYKSKHVSDDRYLKRLIPYVLLNAADLVEPRWREHIKDIGKIKKNLIQYPYSSLPDFFHTKRPEVKIVGSGIREFYPATPSLGEMITEARAFYRDHEKELRKMK